MFGLFRRSRRQPAYPRPRRARLWLEALEPRHCPSAPSLSLAAQVLPGHVVNLSGALMPNPDGHSGGVGYCNVYISGAATGSTLTDCEGHYTYSTTTASLGQVSAVGIDNQGNESNTAQTVITVAPPRLTLSLAYGTQGNIILSGSVTDIDAANRTITLSGAVSTSVTADGNGQFNLSIKPSRFGQIQATTTDLWGLTSNTPSVQFDPTAPTITNFTGTSSYGNMWTFSGTVVGQVPQGMVVQFGGLPQLQNQTAAVQSNGYFSICVQLAPGETGDATAVTTDWWGEQSNVASDVL